MDTNNKIKTLAQEVYSLAQQLAAEAYAINPPPKDIAPLLIAWANAKAEVDAHLNKWAGVKYEDSPEQRAEWGPICTRSHDAEVSLLSYASAFAALERREAAE